MKNIYKWHNLQKKKSIKIHIDHIKGYQANYFKLTPFNLYYIKTTDTILPKNSIQYIFL